MYTIKDYREEQRSHDYDQFCNNTKENYIPLNEDLNEYDLLQIEYFQENYCSKCTETECVGCQILDQISPDKYYTY